MTDPLEAPPVARHPSDHLVPLRDGWALWRDVAVRSAGFPVDGLEVFGPGAEGERLRAVASDPRFREAVTWQNRAALHNAVDKVASGSPASASKQRQREELVAGYWQRYCAKNDTIGFFGPLAWARIVDAGPALDVRRCGAEVDRSVHFEAWCFETLCETLGLPVLVPLGPHPERDVRAQLDQLPDGDARRRGLDALDRLEARRDAIASAPPDGLDAALAALDAEFEALTGRASTRREGTMYGARTLVYLDCMRDLELSVGPTLLDELAVTLPALLAGARWYCGRMFERLGGVVDALVDRAGDGPLAPVLGQAIEAIMAIPPEAGEVNAQLQRRWAALLADPDVTTLARRADAAFADATPGWQWSVFHAPDVQVAAACARDVDAGHFLCVVGDFHPGTNTLGQGLFANRHPDHERFLDQYEADAGECLYLIPPRNTGRITARIMPAVTRPTWTHVAATPDACMPAGTRVVSAADLEIRRGMVTTRAGVTLGTLVELLQHPMFVAGVRTYDPFPVRDHAPRLTVSRTVLRRETWQVPAGSTPAAAGDLAGWARGLGMPRRVFVLSPLEAKPVYLDLDSRVLTSTVARLLRRAAAEQPDRVVRFTEMLPAPEDCWLEDGDGRRYTSELRLVAVDLTARARRTAGAREQQVTT